MRILLISANVARSPYPVYPLGMGIIAAALEDAGHTVAQFDFLQAEGSLDAVSERVRQENPQMVGISLRNIDNTNALNEQLYVPCVRDIIARVRQESDSCVVMGGSGFSVMPEVILDAVGADYGIVGEGERLIVGFAADAARGIFPDVRCIRSEPSLCGGDIGAAHYDPHIMGYYRQNGNLAGVQTKRGCTHKCIYCSYPVLEGACVRVRNPRDVVADIRHLTDDHGVRYIFFTDSVFNDDAGQYRRVVDAMEQAGLRVPWTAFFKPEGLDDGIVAQMKETGLHAAEIGSDASNDTALRKLGKSFCFADIAESSRLFSSHGVASAHYYMFGCPGEDEALVHEGIANLLSLRDAAIFIFMGIRILPGTPLARLARIEGIIPEEDQALLDPVYYISPALNRDWLETALTEAFADLKHCVFPPDSMDDKLHFLHQMGHTGPLWDLLLKERKRKARR